MKPILFNTECVRSLLAGRKTVTRRLVKPQPRAIYHGGTIWDDEGCPVILVEGQNGRLEQITVPYRPGDILYVREAWAKAEGGGCSYKAAFDGVVPPSWRPSIHMPKEAARLFLRVTGVRVERLWDITEEQAEKEGFFRGWSLTEHSSIATSARQAFMWTWNSTVKKADLLIYGWAADPWVWVIGVERISKEEASANA